MLQKANGDGLQLAVCLHILIGHLSNLVTGLVATACIYGKTEIGNGTTQIVKQRCGMFVNQGQFDFNFIDKTKLLVPRRQVKLADFLNHVQALWFY